MTASFKKILIIDDDEVFVKPLRKFLTLNKFQVNVAENGMNGLELQNFLNVDLVITDLRMEGLTGIDVINNVSKTFPNTPVLLMILSSEDLTVIRMSSEFIRNRLIMRN